MVEPAMTKVESGCYMFQLNHIDKITLAEGGKSLYGLSTLEQQNGHLPEVEVDEMPEN